MSLSSLTGVCADCFRGTLRGDAVLTGTVEQVHGLPTYVARPGDGVEPRGVVVIISDGFGWELRNTRAMADNYARRAQLLVYLPDFMNGAAPPLTVLRDTDAVAAPAGWLATLLIKPLHMLRLVAIMLPWMFRTRRSVTRPRLARFLGALRAAAPRLRVGVAGFCWGGSHALWLARDEPATRTSSSSSGPSGGVPLVDCAFAAHPSFVSVPGDILPVRRPVSVANGDDDAFMGRANMVRLRAILEAGDQQQRHEVVVYDGARHGFAIRGDPHDPRQAELGARAEDQAVSWFRRQLHG